MLYVCGIECANRTYDLPNRLYDPRCGRALKCQIGAITGGIQGQGTEIRLCEASCVVQVSEAFVALYCGRFAIPQLPHITCLDLPLRGIECFTILRNA